MNLISVMVIGGGKGKGASRKIWDICLPTIERYAKKVGADFRIHSTELPKFDGTSFFMQKLGQWDYVKEYDRLLCLDADIMVVPDAPDVFETFNEAGVFYGMDSSYTDRAHILQPYADKFGIALPTGSYPPRPRHINGGMWLLDRHCDLRYDVTDYIPCKGYEENFVNYVLAKNDVPVRDTGVKWNKICCDVTTPRRECFFIHHGGWGFDPNWREFTPDQVWESKVRIAQEDHAFFFGGTA
jgi:hypothetical protein